MSPRRIYGLSIWLPLLVPVAVMAVVNVLIKGFGLPRPAGFFGVVFQVLAYSAVYGGLPYLALAVWGSWWIHSRSEPEIRRVMFFAPLLMVAVFGAACLAMGAAVAQMRVWLGVAVLGISIIIPLGYFYVVLTMVLRRWLGPHGIEDAA